MKMKKTYYYCLSLLLALCMAACGDDDGTTTPPDGGTTPEATIEGSTFAVLEGYEDAAQGFSTLKPAGLDDPIYIQDGTLAGSAYHFAAASASRLDELTTRPAADGNSWTASAAIGEGKCYWVRHTTTLLYTYLKLRIAYIDDNSVGVEYITDGTEQRQPEDPDDDTNTNANLPVEGKAYVTDYSMPHLNPENIYVEHTVTYEGAEMLNYALEWVESKRHSAWVAYSFDAQTAEKNVTRTDAWATDPQLPGLSPEESDHKSDGFDKGHLCASDDRAYCTEANEQTFYYSNMSPQINSFNGGYWVTFEQLVIDWARSGEYDKMYIAKGGTVDRLLTSFTGQVNSADGRLPQTDAQGFTRHGLACPQYYFIAVLAQRGNNYQALGFWVEHKEYSQYSNSHPAPVSVTLDSAVSIDQLEEETGLDFFCNLPDAIESEVESQYNAADWDFGD